MKKILINVKGEVLTFKTNGSPKTDKVNILPHKFVMGKIISMSEWAKSKQLIVDKFNIHMEQSQCDGRTKEVKKLPWFTWSILYQLKY